MKNKKDYTTVIARPNEVRPKQSLLGLLRRSEISALLAMTLLTVVPVFAGTEVPVTATATVAPQGEYAPIITAVDQTVIEGGFLQFEVLATDANTADTVTLEISAGQLPWLSIVSNTSGNPARMVLQVAPPMGAIGRYRVYFKATDDSPYNLDSTEDIYITVNPANQPPVITVQNQVVQAGQLLTFTVNCYDPDNSDTVTLTYSGKPSWLSASDPSPVTGNPIDIIFTGTPQVSDEGVYTMTFTAVDDGTPAQSASKEITIMVITSNNPPVLDPIRDKEVPIRVKLEFSIKGTDMDNDPLTYDATGLPFSLGAIFDTFNRRFIWTPTNSQVGDYPVHFEVSDGRLTDSEDIIVYVTSSDAPIFDPLFDKRIKVENSLSFAVTARDPNGDPITYGTLDLPPGASFDPERQVFTWMPEAGQEGTYSVVFTASDGVYTTNKEILIVVQPDPAPVLTPVGEKRIRVGQTLSFTLEATDPDTPINQLTYSVSNNPPGSSLIGKNFSWTPSVGQDGTYPDIIFTVSDGTYSDSSICWIFVLPNGAPIIERIGEKHVVEGMTLVFSVNATDPDGDPLTYLQPLNAPKGSYFDTLTHTFSWTPAIGERGVYNNIYFRVSDGVTTVPEDVWIFVAANDAPVVDPLFEQHVKATHPLSFAISAYDPNGDELIYKALNLPDGATFTDRTFRWTPTLDQVGIYRDILFEVSDGVNIVTVRTWIFVDAPGAPVMERVGERYVTALETLIFTVNATDPDGDPLTYSASNLPPGASFNPQTRAFSWTPAVSQVGTYPNVLFSVTDGIYTVTEISWIFVKGPGAPIINVPGEQRIRAGDMLEFTITATDPDTPLSSLIYSASNLPPGATFSNQVFRWTPTIEQIGTYPDIRFTVSDGTYSDSQVTWIFVISPGAPRFTIYTQAKYGRVGEPIVFSVSATDPDNQPLTYYAVNLPIGATFSNQTFRWMPQQGQEGSYKDVRIEVVDTDNNMDADIFWIFVSGNSAPILDFIGTRYGSAGQLLTFTISAVDTDQDPLTFSASYLPAGALFNPLDQRFSWTPTQAGTYTGIHFEVTDGALTDSEDISIVVSP
jgi:hypothetical protein